MKIGAARIREDIREIRRGQEVGVGVEVGIVIEVIRVF